jgi:hypothetical protein
MIEGKSGEEAVRSPRVHDQWMPSVLQVEPRFDHSTLPADLNHARSRSSDRRVQMVVREARGKAFLTVATRACRGRARFGTAFSSRLATSVHPRA